MTATPALSRPTRLMTVAAVCALHATMLALFLLSRGPPVSEPIPATSLQLVAFELKAPPAEEQKAPPRPSLIRKATITPMPPAPPSPSLENSDNAGAGGACATLAAVSAAINADPDAVARIQAAPPQLRSVAGAVVIWNAGWSDGVRLPQDPLQHVRKVIEATLQDVDRACLDEQIVGPRLVAVPYGDYTMYAVLGSGTWSWAQMLLPDGVAPAPLPGASPTEIPWPKSEASAG